MKVKIKKSSNFCGIHYINMVDISRQGIKEIVWKQ